MFYFCTIILEVPRSIFNLHSTAKVFRYLLQNCSPGPALIFEGEESMIAAISEDPLSFKVCCFSQQCYVMRSL